MSCRPARPRAARRRCLRRYRSVPGCGRRAPAARCACRWRRPPGALGVQRAAVRPDGRRRAISADRHPTPGQGAEVGPVAPRPQERRPPGCRIPVRLRSSLTIRVLPSAMKVRWGTTIRPPPACATPSGPPAPGWWWPSARRPSGRSRNCRRGRGPARQPPGRRLDRRSGPTGRRRDQPAVRLAPQQPVRSFAGRDQQAPIGQPARPDGCSRTRQMTSTRPCKVDGDYLARIEIQAPGRPSCQRRPSR